MSAPKSLKFLLDFDECEEIWIDCQVCVVNDYKKLFTIIIKGGVAPFFTLCSLLYMFSLTHKFNPLPFCLPQPPCSLAWRRMVLPHLCCGSRRDILAFLFLRTGNSRYPPRLSIHSIIGLRRRWATTLRLRADFYSCSQRTCSFRPGDALGTLTVLCKIFIIEISVSGQQLDVTRASPGPGPNGTGTPSGGDSSEPILEVRSSDCHEYPNMHSITLNHQLRAP